MNSNQLVNMITRAVMRAAIAIGITKGIGMIANRGKNPEEMTPEERMAAKKTERTSRQAVKRARDVMRITRRMR